MAHRSKKFLVIGLFLAGFSANAAPALQSDMVQLDILGYDSMNKLTTTKAASCQPLENEEYSDCMKVVFETILVRRDQNDGVLSKLFSLQYYKLDDGLRNSILTKITNESIERMKDEATVLKEKSSSIEILKNLISELNPKSSEHRPIIQKISDANLEISEDLSNMRLKKMGMKTTSPSEIAKGLLTRVAPQEELKKAENNDIKPVNHKKMTAEDVELPSLDLDI